MIEPVFVDTNVIVYRYDSSVPDKQSRADEWLRLVWDRRSGRLSTQVLQEFYSTVTREMKPAMPVADARRLVRRLSSWRPLPSTSRFWNALGSCRIAFPCPGGTPRSWRRHRRANAGFS